MRYSLSCFFAAFLIAVTQPATAPALSPAATIFALAAAGWVLFFFEAADWDDRRRK